MKNLFVIPTMGMSTLYKRNDLGTYHIGPFDLCKPGDDLRTNQYVYVTNDEDIKDNDYIITKDGRLVQVSYLLSEDLIGGTKVVITNDPLLIKDGVQGIDEKFLNWFVDNSSCEFVKVEKECCGQCDERLCEIRDLQREETKYNTFYKIIIPSEEWISPMQKFTLKEETKQPILYTEEEVRSWLIHRDVYLYNYYTTYKNLDIPLQSVDDFIDENHEYLMNREK